MNKLLDWWSMYWLLRNTRYDLSQSLDQVASAPGRCWRLRGLVLNKYNIMTFTKIIRVSNIVMSRFTKLNNCLGQPVHTQIGQFWSTKLLSMRSYHMRSKICSLLLSKLWRDSISSSPVGFLHHWIKRNACFDNLPFYKFFRHQEDRFR